MSMGLVPRVGPLRALVLGCKTKLWFLRPDIIMSQRTSEVVAFNNMFNSLSTKHYAVVAGSKGVGKSTIISTGLYGKPGVVFVDVMPGASGEKIISDALQAVTNISLSIIKPSSSAKRVVKWHKRFFFQPPTVVLCARERSVGEQHAKLGSAVRVLLEHGLRVVIDSSDNSLQAVANTALRHDVLQVEDMPRDIIEEIPEIQELLEALKTAGLAELVWAVLGGNPAAYTLLDQRWKREGGGDIIPVAKAFIDVQLRQAAHAISDAPAAFNQVFKLFKASDSVPRTKLIELDIQQPSPDKVLRVRGVAEKEFLVPATSAVALVLRYGEAGDAPSFQKLREVLGLDALKPASPQQLQ